MQVTRFGSLAVAALLVGALATAQNSSPTPQSAPSPTSAPATSRHKKPRKPVAASPVQRIPLETAPPSPPTPPAATAQQKAADERLLQQQQQQSAQAATITNQQVQAAQKQKDAIQNEVRIQDAPGPAQTGVVPASGPPVAPVNADQRIQDAPGPAQTLPPLPTPAPAAPPQ